MLTSARAYVSPSFLAGGARRAGPAAAGFLRRRSRGAGRKWSTSGRQQAGTAAVEIGRRAACKVGVHGAGAVGVDVRRRRSAAEVGVDFRRSSGLALRSLRGGDGGLAVEGRAGRRGGRRGRPGRPQRASSVEERAGGMARRPSWTAAVSRDGGDGRDGGARRRRRDAEGDHEEEREIDLSLGLSTEGSLVPGCAYARY